MLLLNTGWHVLLDICFFPFVTEKDRKAWKSAKGVDFDQQTVVCRAAICWSKYTTADPGPYKDDIVCSVKKHSYETNSPF